MQLSRRQRIWLKFLQRFKDKSPTAFDLFSTSPFSVFLPAVVVAIALSVLAALEILNVHTALFAIGMVAGAFLRDIGRFRFNAHMWPIVNEITNWQAVDELLSADSKSSE
jgi:hypothetical protein